MKTTKFQKQQAELLGRLGELIIREKFKGTKGGGRSFDIRIPIEKRPYVGWRVECKTRKLRKGGVTVKFTRHQRTHSDSFAILILNTDFELIKLYLVPTWAMPREKGYIFFGKTPTKYENYKLV